MSDLATRTVSINSAKSALRHAFKKRRPLFIWGPPGIGKSDAIHQLGTELNAHVIEIGVFAISGLLLRRLEPGTLLLLGGLGGILRWTVTAFTADVSILAVLQPLHGLTFCANFLGATYFIGRNVRVDVSASAQSLNAVASSAAMGLGMFFAGPLYSLLGGEAFLVMSLLSACSALGAWQLQRRWRGGEIG